MTRVLVAIALACALVAQTPFRTTLAAEATKSQQYQSGQQVQATDLSGDFEAVRNLSGILATLLLGSPNALPNNNPLAITLSGSAMSLSIGGSGQFVIAQDVGTSGNARIIDSCPAQAITIPANTTGRTRTDLLSIQYQQIQTSGHNVAFSDGSVRTVYNALEGCAYTYSTGSVTPPSGYVAFASISVPNNATTGSQATVTYLFSTVRTLLQNALGGVVSALNGTSGSVTLVGSSGITVAPGSGNTITIGTTLPANPMTAFNGLSGAITLESVGGTITVSSIDASHVDVEANFPAAVNALNGATGNVTLQGGAGVSISTSGSTITATNTGVTNVGAADGSLSFSSGTGSVAASIASGYVPLGGQLFTSSIVGNTNTTQTISLNIPSYGGWTGNCTFLGDISGGYVTVTGNLGGSTVRTNDTASLEFAVAAWAINANSATATCTVVISGSSSPTGSQIPGTLQFSAIRTS